MLSGRPEKPPSALLHALADSVVGVLSSTALSGSMCFVKLAETHIPLARERSVSLHGKISRDIDRYFSDIGTALPWVTTLYTLEIRASMVLNDRRSERILVCLGERIDVTM